MMTFPAPHSALAAVQDMQRSVADLGLEVRAGMHTGEVEISGADLAGISVNIAARISALAAGGEVLVSETVRDFLRPTGTACLDRGSHELKGIPGSVRLFAAGEPERLPVADLGSGIRWRDRVVLGLARHAPGLARSVTSRLRRPAPASAR